VLSRTRSIGCCIRIPNSVAHRGADRTVRLQERRPRPARFSPKSPLPAELRASVQVSVDQLDAPTPAEVGAARAIRVREGYFKKRRGASAVSRSSTRSTNGLRPPRVWRWCAGTMGAPSVWRASDSSSTRSLDGTSLRALCQAASELGLAARSVKASPRNFEQMPLRRSFTGKATTGSF